MSKKQDQTIVDPDDDQSELPDDTPDTPDTPEIPDEDETEAPPEATIN